MDFTKHRTSKDEIEPINKNVDHTNWEDCYPKIKDCKKVLDVGCGGGVLMQYMKERGHEVYGVTYSKEEVKYCKNLGLEVINCDIHEIIYDDEQFDAVICWDTLEHTLAPLIVLKEIRRVLKYDGIAMIYMPGQNWIEFIGHIIVLNERQMLHLLYLTGFKSADIYKNYGTHRSGIAITATAADTQKDDICYNSYANGLMERLKELQRKEMLGSATYIVRKESENTDVDPI